MALRKMFLEINGAERLIVCEPEDKLSSVIRALGLTGTKVGCDAGQCGACSVILDGKVVRSCTKKMKSVAEHSKITTIEGIGTTESTRSDSTCYDRLWGRPMWFLFAGIYCFSKRPFE